MTSKRRVLFVDDDEELHHLLMTLFKRNDVPFVFDFATSAGGACSLMSIYCYDAVVLDYNLPDFTGATVGPKLREKNPTIPLAFLTDYVSEELADLADEIGAEYWLKLETVTKDGGLDLIHRVVGLLDGGQCSQQEANDDRRSRTARRGSPPDTGERRRSTDKPVDFGSHLMASFITPIKGRARRAHG